VRRKFGVGLELNEPNLDARGGHPFCTFETTFGHKALDLARVGLVFDMILAPADYHIKDTPVLGVR